MSASDAMPAVEAAVAAGSDADDVLRNVVAALHEQGGLAWAGILFVERGELVLGPAAGDEDAARRASYPIAYRGERIGELAVDGADEGDEPALERVAELVAEHCLVGWDTGGEAWKP
jgi:hypothetical protein